MDSIEKAHRHKSVELEKIEIKTGGKLNLKLFAYPVKNQTYPGKLAFVVYYEYETRYGFYTNFEKRSGSLDRFWIDKNHNLTDLLKSGELALTLRSQSYGEIRWTIIQEAVFNSVKQKPLKSSLDNIKWFNDHRDEFSKPRIVTNNFAPNKKYLEAKKTKFEKVIETLPQIEIIKETHYEETPETEEVIEVEQVEEVVNKTSTLLQVKHSGLKIPVNLKDTKNPISSGLRKFLKKHAA